MTTTQIKKDFLEALTNDPTVKTAVREALVPEVLTVILSELREMRR